MPGLYIITGSNGAGKSSFGSAFLPIGIQDRLEVLDGDKLFLKKRRELYPTMIPSLKEAKRIAGDWLMDHFREKTSTALESRADFAYEGHFVAKETWDIPRRFLAEGYQLYLVFLGLSSVELSSLRVLDRAIHGGHNVPPAEIEINFNGNLRKVNEHYRWADYLILIDTSEALSPKPLSEFLKGQVLSSLPSAELPSWFQYGLPDLFQDVLYFEKWPEG